MSSPHRLSATRTGMLLSAAALSLALVGAPEPAGASAPRPDAVVGSHATVTPAGAGDWVWPVAGARKVVRGFEAPASRYSAGHRGIDIAAPTGSVVIAPEAGTVHFAGIVVDRPTFTIETSEGILISMEPVTSELVPGGSVLKGAVLGAVSTGGHCSNGCLHLGVRVAGEYVSPMRYFGGIPRAVLLPLR